MAVRMAQGCTRQLWQTLQGSVKLPYCCIKQITNSRVFCAPFHSGLASKYATENVYVFSSHYKHQTLVTSLSFTAIIRLNSSTTANESTISTPTDSSSYIPPAPPIPDASEAVSEMAGAFNALGEPTLQSMGLGGFWPPGLIQQGLEFLHAGLGLPWWGAIVAGTLVMRLCMFPLVIKAQKMSINVTNHMPTVQRLQLKFTQARQRGNMLDAMRYGGELSEYMKRNNVKPFGQLMMPLCQLPVFVSVFVGLRKMANLPVESMKTGGVLWFPDLTVAEPFYGLPLMTAFTFWLTIESGVDGVSAQSQTHVLKWFLRCMPVIMIPFISNFPAAMLVYWFTSNSFSLVQVLFLKIPSVRQFFKIPEKFIQTIEPTEKKGFLEGFKESYSNMKASQHVTERHRLDEISYRKAAHGPIVKTYPYNPKKVDNMQKLMANALETKSKS